MAQIETWLKTDLQQIVKVQELGGNLFSADNQANRIGVIVTNKGESVSLSGSVTGYIIRSDEATVVVSGSLSGNRAWVDLPASVYVKTGPFSIVIKIGNTTIGAACGFIRRTITDTIVDPGHIIPSLSELLAQIETMRQLSQTVTAQESGRVSAETARGEAESARANAEASRVAAETQRESDFSTAKTAAENATSAANTAAGKISNMTVAATGLPAGSSPTVAISEVDGHKHIAFGLVKGDPGKDFEIRKTFASIAQMLAYDPDTDPSSKKVRDNDFVMIDTGSVQDADTGKLYCYEPETQDVWRYIGDLSGSQGIKGETGTGIANITLNQDYTLTITMDDGQTSYTTGSIRGAQGQQGVQGDPGNDGYSPTVTVTTITGGHRVSVTDATATSTFDIFDGTSEYIHIKYSHTQPAHNTDMGNVADDWMGIYSGSSETAPASYTSYTWYKIKGEGTVPDDGSITLQKLSNSLRELITIEVDSREETEHDGLGEISHTVSIKDFDSHIYGNALIATNPNMFQFAGQASSTNNGVTLTPRENGAFNVDGTVENSTYLGVRYTYFDDDKSYMRPVVGEKVVFRIFTTFPLQVKFGVMYTTSTGYELKDTSVVQADTGKFHTITVNKTVPDASIGVYVKFYAPIGTVLENETVWVGMFHEGTTFTDLGNTPPVSGQTTLSELSTLFYPSVVTYIEDTKKYVDQFGGGGNESLTYVTPEKFYGGTIPSNVDASTYINQAIAYASTNHLQVFCGGKYNTFNSIMIDSVDCKITINKLYYTGNGSCAILVKKQRANVQIKYMESTSDGVLFSGNSTNDDASNCVVQIDYAKCAGDVLHVISEENESLTSGRNSYNTIIVQRAWSTTKSVINIDTGSGSTENRIYGRYVRTNADYAIKDKQGGNIYYNFCIEDDALSGILTASNNTFVDIRSRECEDHMWRESGRTFCKLLAGYTRNVSFIGRSHVFPYSIDVSDVVVPPEDIGNSQTGPQYGLYVSQPIVSCFAYRGRMASYYMGNASRYNCEIGGWAYNFDKKLICKAASDNMLDISTATVDMNYKDQVSALNILANSAITLSPSYCGEGINELFIDQTHGYTATITADNGTVVFDGATLGAGKYLVKFLANKLPFTPVSATYYTYFYGKNYSVIVEKCSDVGTDAEFDEMIEWIIGGENS